MNEINEIRRVIRRNVVLLMGVQVTRGWLGWGKRVVEVLRRERDRKERIIREIERWLNDVFVI